MAIVANAYQVQKTSVQRVNTIFKENATGLFLDSMAVIIFLKSFPVSDSVKREIFTFYTLRRYQLAWFTKTGMIAAAPNFYNQLQNYQSDFADNSFKNARFNSLFTLAQADDKKFVLKRDETQELELLLTSTFFLYSKKVYGGIVNGPATLNWYIPAKKRNYRELLDSMLVAEKGENIAEPLNEYYTRLKGKLKLYRIILKDGGFPRVSAEKKQYQAGDSDSCIINAKQHLFLSGDLKLNDRTILFSDSLANAVLNFQHRMGLPENGKLDAPTIKELNITVEYRIKQMLINMERLRWVPVEMENDYLLVNIPEFRLHIFENKQQVWMTNVVVGKAATRTSIFKGNVSEVILNPYWNIPASIVRNEILPHMKRDASYLKNHNMEVVSGNQIRQRPGINNALGKMKFIFPNDYRIYLHDTPSKDLFEESKRAFSHGCIRVKDPRKLALYLLKNNSDWNMEKIDNILTTDKSLSIPVLPSVPVYIAYFTAWVDNTGQLNFRNDIYNMDSRIAKEIFNN